jgi:3',5'-cyclic AMP phosphodiesterase CpdA
MALPARAAVACACVVAMLAAGCGGEERSAPPRPAGAVVWAVGDGANGSATSRALAERIAADEVDRFLYLGDVYEDGTAREFDENYDTVYGELARRTAPTPGNHDWPNRDKGYDRYWERVRGEQMPSYYSFRLGGWQVLSVNSEQPHGPRSRQYRWLRAAMRGGGTCRLAFSHRPRFSAGTVHGDQEDMSPVWDLLRGRATIMLSGHEHNMQRLRPIGGLTQLISGAGGDGRYPVEEGDRRLAFANDSDYGALRLELRPGRARFSFIDDDGRTLDSGRVFCRVRGRALA